MTYTEEDYEEVLAHFGVKGMRWGERKERSPAEQDLHDRRVKSAGLAAGVGVATYIVTGGNPVAAGAVAAGSYFVAKHSVYPAKSFSSTQTEAGKATVDGIVKRQGKN